MHPVTTATNISGPAAALWAHVVSDLTAVRCAKCANVLPRSAFHQDLSAKNGLRCYCKTCANTLSLKFYHTCPTAKIHNKLNKRKNKETARKWSLNKYKTDPQFRLRKLIRNRIRQSLKQNGKSEPTMKLLGCSIDFLRQHLESQFKSGMTWENQGKIWHIDHIKPCASFDLTQPEQQRICFHFSNLQPLFAEDNLKKGAKLDYHADDNSQRI